MTERIRNLSANSVGSGLGGNDMAKVFYIVSNPYLSLTGHPGTLSDLDIVRNLARMMENDYTERGEEAPGWEALMEMAWQFYGQNREKIDHMASRGAELVLADELEESSLTVCFENWLRWDFEDVEWD